MNLYSKSKNDVADYSLHIDIDPQLDSWNEVDGKTDTDLLRTPGRKRGSM